MRLWSLHPKHLDAKGLVALWREALLAQKVLQGRTRGYKHHPQLERFRKHSAPLAAIAVYLRHVQEEAESRGYSFNKTKIGKAATFVRIPVHKGQVAYEKKWLAKKLNRRDPAALRRLGAAKLSVHPVFRVVPGPRETWEVVQSPS